MWPGDASGCEDSRSGRSRVLCRGRVRRGEDGLGRKKRRSLFENPKIDGPQPPNRSSMAATVCDSRISPRCSELFYPLSSRVYPSSLFLPLRCADWEPGESRPTETDEQTALQNSQFRGARRGRPDASSVVSGMSAYTTPVRDGAGHMVMAPTPPTNIRNLIAQKEKVRIRLMLRTTIIQLPPEVHSAEPPRCAPSNKLHRSSSRSPSSA